MKTKLTFLLALTFLFLFSGFVYGDDLQDAGDAYNRKDYKSASEETTEDPLDTINRYLYPPVEDPPIITLEEGPPLLEEELRLAMVAQINGDYKMAAEKLKPFLAQGNPIAQYVMSLMYFKGQGVLQDFKEAFKLLKLAAEQGHSTARYDLAVAYIKGNGVEPNPKKALALFLEMATIAKDIFAQVNLGKMYRDGLGVIQNYTEAHKWFNIAGANYGQPGPLAPLNNAMAKDARKERKKIEKIMTPDQISKAQKLAKEWVDKNK